MTNEHRNECSREARIVAAACRELGLTAEDLFSRKRDQETVTGRQLLYFVLSHAGCRVTQIAATLERHHSTVVAGLKKVERNTALRSEGERVTALVVPFLGAARDGVLPVATIAQAVTRALRTKAPPHERAAVRAYVCGALLGREQVPATQAAWGLCLLTMHPEWRTVVEEVLMDCQLAAYAGLIDVQLQRTGIRAPLRPDDRPVGAQARQCGGGGAVRVLSNGSLP